MQRRLFTRLAAGAGLLLVAGCTGSEDGYDIKIEYHISGPKTHEELPQEVVEHPNPEDFRWFIVEFEIVEGSLDAADIMGLTQLRLEGTDHFTRAVAISSPDNELFTSEQESYDMDGGTQGEAYYRVEETAGDQTWIIDQLENQYGTIELISM